MDMLCHFGFNNPVERANLQHLAGQLGLQYVFAYTGDDTFRTSALVLEASLVCIWNGKQLGSSLMTEICESRGIPKFYLEWGMLPQSEHYFVDPCGFCGDSILNSDLTWVTDEDILKYKDIQKRLQDTYTLEDNGYILVPLQRSRDSQILYYTKYNSMQQFIDEVQYMYPNNNILIKPHPKERRLSFNPGKCRIADVDDDFMELASKASAVVGLTSTSLYEAATLGKNVISLGNHPISNQLLDNRERLLAGINALNVHRQGADIKKILDRFGIEPR
jgi:hypothetical protein